jgi:hypothetical protein
MPGCPKMPEDKNHGIRSSQQQLIRQFVIHHNINRVAVRGIPPMPRQNATGRRTLQRGEPKEATRIPPQNKLDQPVA